MGSTASFLTCRVRRGHANNTPLTGEHGSDKPLSPDFLFKEYRRFHAAVLDKRGETPQPGAMPAYV